MKKKEIVVAKAKSKKKIVKTAAKAKKPAAKKPAAKPAVKASPKAAVKATPKTSAKATAQQISKLAASLAPLDDRILVQVAEGERVTAGGLIIPDSAQTTGNSRGVVVAAGKGHTTPKGKFRPTELKVGDRILFGEHAGQEVELGSDKFKIMRETDVLGLMDSE